VGLDLPKLYSVLRFTDFRLDASAIQQLPDGSLKVVGQLTRPGIFSYRNPDGTERREWRPAAEVFKAEALASFASSTVTLNHPAARKVTSATWKSSAIGHLGENVREDAGHMVSDVYVREDAAVQNVLNGKARFLSCGYRVDYDPTPGVTPEGERYDGIQRNIRGNHVALLIGEAPRGGLDCTLRLDSSGDEVARPLNSDVELEALKAKVTVLESELQKARLDSAEMPKLTADLTKANTDLAVAIAQVSPERLDALVEERTAIVAVAKAAGVETAGKSALVIKRAIVAKRTPELAARVDSFGAESIDAILAVYQTLPHPSMTAVVAVAGVDAVRADAAVDANAIPTIADLYAKSLLASQNAWKNSGDSPQVKA
jgi:hypothetical protein